MIRVVLTILFISLGSLSVQAEKCDDFYGFDGSVAREELLNKEIQKIIDFDIYAQRERDFEAYTEEVVEMYKSYELKWDKDSRIYDEENYSWFEYRDIWTLASDFGRLNGKYPRVQKYIRSKKPGNLYGEIENFRNQKVTKVLGQSPYARTQYEYSIPYVVAAIDLAHSRLPKTKGVFFRGGYLLDGMEVHPIGKTFINEGFLSVSEDFEVAKGFINNSMRNFFFNSPKWREFIEGTPKHDNILLYDRVIQVYDFREQGERALWMPAVYQRSNEKVDSTLDSEREHLFPRGMKLQVYKRKKFNSGGYGPIYIEIIKPIL